MNKTDENKRLITYTEFKATLSVCLSVCLITANQENVWPRWPTRRHHVLARLKLQDCIHQLSSFDFDM